LVITYLKTKWFERKDRELFYQNPNFRKIDETLLHAYRFKNPYAISREFLLKKGEQEIYTYGETPLSALNLIALQAALTPQDRLIDLGCGRGRSSFFFAFHTQCPVKGIDWVPTFVEIANPLAKRFLPNLSFECLNMLDADLSNATAIYLAGTCLDERTILLLSQKLPSKTKVITISYPLSDYDPSFSTEKEFSVQFPWGQTTAFIQAKNQG